MSKEKNTALVVSGGGCKGAFAVGVVKYLFKTYHDTGWFKIVGGTSTGALVSPMAALMAAPEPTCIEALNTLEHIYSSVGTSDILEKQNIFELIRRQDCLYESDPLNDLIHKLFRPEWFDWLQGPNAPECYVVYVNYQNGEKVVASPRDENMTHERFMQSMMASASVPVVMEATKIDEQVCYDGGVRDLLPFGKAIELGADMIIPIFLDPEKFPETTSRFRRLDKVLLRTLEILTDEVGRNDFSIAQHVNTAIQAKSEIMRTFKNNPEVFNKLEEIFNKDEFKGLFGKRVVNIVSGIRPDMVLTQDSLTFEASKMSQWVAWGEKKASEIITENPFVLASK